MFISFVPNYLHAWISSVLHSDLFPDDVSLDLYKAGEETIFSPDTLRLMLASFGSRLFDAIKIVLLSSPDLISILPRIFASYVQALRKYSNVRIIPTKLQPCDINSRAMQCYVVCKSIIDGSPQSRKSWAVRLSLLSVVEHHALFDSQQLHLQTVLVDDLQRTTMTLHQFDTEIATRGMEVVLTLFRLHPILVIAELPRILPKISFTQHARQLSLELLELLLAHHIKTCELDKYIKSFFSAFTSHMCTQATGELYETHQLCLSGPIFHPTHLKRLSKAVSRFLSDNQITRLVNLIIGYLEEGWGLLIGDVQVDKGRKDETIQGSHSTALSFSLSARLAAVVLSSISLQCVPETNSVIHPVSQGLRDLRKFSGKVAAAALKRSTKQHDQAQLYAIISAASLNLQYALNESNHSLVKKKPDKSHHKIIQAFTSGATIPELRLEIARTLLRDAFAMEGSRRDILFNVILEQLETMNDDTSSLSIGSSQYPLSLLRLVIDRYLPMIDFHGSCVQLGRLVQLLVTSDLNECHEKPTIFHRDYISISTIQSAQIWELANLRNAFLSHVHHTTSAFNDRSLSLSSSQHAIATYSLLLRVPMEWLPLTSRLQLTRQALLTDRKMNSSPDQGILSRQTLVVIRTFLARVFSYSRVFDSSQIPNYCASLQEWINVETLDGRCRDVTLDLVDLLFTELIRTSNVAESQPIQELLEVFHLVNVGHLYGKSFVIQAFLRLMDVLERDFSPKVLSKKILASIYRLHGNLTELVLRVISSQDYDSLSARTFSLTVWSSLLSFGKWLSLTDNKAPHLGKELLSKIVTPMAVKASVGSSQAFLATFCILQQETRYCTDRDRSFHLKFVIVAYCTLPYGLDPLDQARLEHCVSRLCKTLTGSEFSYVLNFVLTFLPGCTSPKELGNVANLCRVLIRNRPKKTLKNIQDFSSCCIQIFSRVCDHFDGSMDLCVRILRYVAQHCNEQFTVLRASDMNNIWTLISKFLSPSPVHDDDTNLDVFHTIIAIMRSLVRLRQDLVTLTLPHLGRLLRQLMLLIPRLRPHLGTRQTNQFTNRQPKWLNARHPIGVEATIAYSRLLESLATKTPGFSRHADERKTGSVTKPFSKHAAPILSAYVAAMSNPFCNIPFELRKELQPGLFALCGMLSEHGRLNMMAAIPDSGGKIVMKLLWNAYEKQRYVGQG